MHKRILIAEENDTIRGVAETVLRQNGFEVISVASVAKVMEVLEFSLPNLLLVSAALKGPDDRFCYESIQTHPRAASIPMLILAGPEGEQLPFPEESIVPQPFDPDILVRRVMAYSSQAGSPPAAANPLDQASLDDELLDAALGLDSLNITESEDMDKTVVNKPAASKGAEKMMGLGHFAKGDDLSESTRIESLILSEDTTDIKHTSDARDKAKDEMSVTSGIDIMTDQYGLTDPKAFDMKSEDQEHDYDWFINSMREDSQPGSEGVVAEGSPAPPQGSAEGAGVDELKVADRASMVDPVTPGPSTPVSTDQHHTVPPAKQEAPPPAKGEGVDKFIDEFKKEIERIRSDEPETVVLEQPSSDGQAVADEAGAREALWEDKIEKITPEHMEMFTRELISHVAEKIAERITGHLDSETLLHLVKTEIVEYLRKNPKG
jgi:CheY-like chemotaxis protein